jgi:hypothetical protein
VVAAGARLSVARFQALALEVELRSADEEVLAAAEFLRHRARQPQTPAERLTLTVTRRGSTYEIADSDVIDRAPDAGAVLATVFAIVQARLLSCFPDHALARGAVIRSGAARLWLAGPPRCGITSLTLASLYAGAAVEGDAFALLGADGLTALPRRFVLQPGADALVSQVRLVGLPTAPSGNGVVWAFDPSEAGFDWEIRRGPIDCCIWVEPNHGGDSRLERVAQTQMLRMLMSRCSPPSGGGRRWIRELVALLDGARCARLQLGRLPDAVALLRGLAEDGGADR